MELTKKTVLLDYWVQQLATTTLIDKKNWCQCEEPAIVAVLFCKDIDSVVNYFIDRGTAPSADEAEQMMWAQQITDLQQRGEPAHYSTRLYCLSCLTRFVENTFDMRTNALLDRLFGEPTRSLVVWRFYGELSTTKATILSLASMLDIHALMASLAAL